MRRQKLAAAAALWVGLSLTLCSCAAAPAAQPIEITLMHGWGGSGADHVAMRAIYDDFQRQNPDIVLAQKMSPDISVVLEKANDMLALNRMPDIISTNGGGAFVANAMQKQLALDLKPYLDSDPVFAASVPDRVLDIWQTPDGAVYTLPDAREVIGYWYNEELLRACGITDTGTAQGTVVVPDSWDAFFAMCETLSQAQIAVTALVPQQKELLFGVALASSGADGLAFMKGQTETCRVETAEAALALLARLEAYALSETYNEAECDELFLTGKTALYFNGVWSNMQLSQAAHSDKFQYAAFPGTNGNRLAYHSYSSGYVVSNTGSPEKIEACVRFVKYMLSDSVQQRIVTQTKQAAASPAITLQWIAQSEPMLGQALAVCDAAPESLLTLSTLLTAADSNAVSKYFSLPSPSQAQREQLLSIVTDFSPDSKENGKNNAD